MHQIQLNSEACFTCPMQFISNVSDSKMVSGGVDCEFIVDLCVMFFLTVS